MGYHHGNFAARAVDPGPVLYHVCWGKPHVLPPTLLGLQGIPRRYSDYPDSMTTWNVVSSSGRLISIIGAMIFTGTMWGALTSQANARRADRVRVEFSPRVPTSWHTFNEATLLG